MSLGVLYLASYVRSKNYNVQILDFTGGYQGIPVNGFTAMFENMVDSSNISIHYNCEKDEWKKYKADLVIYTGRLDEYFDCCFGTLAYRSLEIEYDYAVDRGADFSTFQTIGKPGQWNFKPKDKEEEFEKRRTEILELISKKNIFIGEKQ